MTESIEYLEQCPTCGVTTDTSSFEPLAQVSCPECGGLMVVSSSIAHYELIEAVGRGGMGVVYKARDTSLDRMVALKVLRKDHSQHAEFISQLETEAAITASINHPHVVRVFTTGTDAGRFYLAMELVDKGTLDDLIGLQGQVAEAQVLEIGIQIAQGLRAAYQHGLIHRDVKPGNILFADSHTAKIVDFGLAMLEAASQGGGEIWGTPYYVAPEKLDQKPEDFRSDMYSLGATLFHAVAGRPPFEAQDASRVALKHLKSQAVSLQAFAPNVSSATAYVINRTLLKDPDQRYQSYDELIEHLDYARTELEKRGAQTQPKQRVILETEEDQKLWSYLTFATLGVILLIGIGAFFYLRSQKSTSTTASATPTAQGAARGIDSKRAGAYDEARKLLLDGKFVEAEKAFQGVVANPKTPAPLVEWSLVHAALAELLAGKGVDANLTLTELGRRNLSDASLQKENAGKAMESIVQLSTADGPVSPQATKGVSRENAEALVPLVLGLRNWANGYFDEAGTLLRQYQGIQFQGETTWMGAYKPLIEDYLADIVDYAGASQLVKNAKGQAEERKAAESIGKLKNGLKTKGALVAHFEKLQDELQKKGSQRVHEDSKREGSDKSAVAAARLEVIQLAVAWKFEEAMTALKKVKVETSAGQRQLYAQLRRLSYLQKWKELAISEINANPTKFKLRRKDGSDLKGTPKATNDGIQTDAGQVPWAELGQGTLLETAVQLVKEDGSPDTKWLTGVYAAMLGVKQESLLADGARAREEYMTALPLVSPAARWTEQNLLSGKKLTASGSANSGESPEKAIDGDLKTKWCDKSSGQKWLQADMGEATTASYWIVRHASTGGETSDFDTVNYELQASDDAKDWKTVDRVSNNTARTTYRNFVPVAARYFRLLITKPSSKDNTARIPEIELRGPAKVADGQALTAAFFDSGDLGVTPKLSTAEIGRLDKHGSVSQDPMTGALTISGAGEDIWGTDDAFQFAYQKLKGDGELVVRVTEVEDSHEWVKGGLMFRESLAPNAKNVTYAVTPKPRVTLQNRSQSGAQTNSEHAELPKIPAWIKLVRAGSKFTGYTSTDGIDWKEDRSTQVSMSEDVYVGLAVTSHQWQELATAKFDFFSIHATGAQPGVPKTSAQSRFKALDLRSVFTADVRHGIFKESTTPADFAFTAFGTVEANGVPYEIVDPVKSGKTVTVLKGGEGFAQSYPQKVELALKDAGAAKALHVLGGVGGWAWPCCGDNNNAGVPVLRITVVEAGGKSEVFELKNGVDIVDYYKYTDVPGSAFAMDVLAGGRQIRTLELRLKNPAPIQKIVLESLSDKVAPMVVAMTAELAGN